MLPNTAKIARLKMAIALLQEADSWVKAALGDTDSYQFTQEHIQNVIDDLVDDVTDLDTTVV